jgi:hypothetical protein
MSVKRNVTVPLGSSPTDSRIDLVGRIRRAVSNFNGVRSSSRAKRSPLAVGGAPTGSGRIGTQRKSPLIVHWAGVANPRPWLRDSEAAAYSGSRQSHVEPAPRAGSRDTWSARGQQGRPSRGLGETPSRAGHVRQRRPTPRPVLVAREQMTLDVDPTGGVPPHAWDHDTGEVPGRLRARRRRGASPYLTTLCGMGFGRRKRGRSRRRGRRYSKQRSRCT